MLRQRTRRAYSDDSDLETERKDKIFKPPIRIKEWPRMQKVVLYVALGLLAMILLVAYRMATLAMMQDPNTAGMRGFVCTQIGLTEIVDPGKFTFVVLGHLALPDKDLRTSLRAVRPHVRAGDSIVIALRKRRKLEHMVALVEEELRSILGEIPIKLCESNHAHEAWRELWNRKLVSKNFIIADQIALLSSSWRDWMEQMKRKNTKSILSLQRANDHFVVGTDSTNQFKISTVPSFGALIPPSGVWQEFLTWFDSDPVQFERVGGKLLPTDVPNDGWELQYLGHHGAWTKPFAQFIAKRQYKVLHAHPPLAYSLYEQNTPDQQ